ncbi:hypothetical protein Nmel_000677 [Mimus melanotis]
MQLQSTLNLLELTKIPLNVHIKVCCILQRLYIVN